MLSEHEKYEKLRILLAFEEDLKEKQNLKELIAEMEVKFPHLKDDE
jgi:hypothetical protein